MPPPLPPPPDLPRERLWSLGPAALTARELLAILLGTGTSRRDALALADDLLVPGVLMRGMFAAIAVLALFLLFRGHNLPGGGFTAGIALAIAFILQYMASGTRWFEERIELGPVRLMGVGLAIAAITGAGAWLFARPFLTSHVAHLEVPLIGPLHLPSAFLFDIGVFALVVGATVLMLIAIAHQSVRSHRAPRGREPGPRAASPRAPEVQ